MNRFAIDLTWVRHKIVGGTESYIMNLLEGMRRSKYDFEAVLVVAADNAELFERFCEDKRFVLCKMDVVSANVWKRIVWQNLSLSKRLEEINIERCFEPVYCKPILFNRKIKYISVIHDLQALYYPKMQSLAHNVWLRICWFITAKTSYKLVGITDYVVADICKRYHVKSSRIKRIYNPIIISNELCEFDTVGEKYDIQPNEYYFTVAKLNSHKNLLTLIKVFGQIKKSLVAVPQKLVISGPNGKMLDEIRQLAKDYEIENDIIITGYVDDAVLAALYKNCRKFLFPSIFEGFGMPPIEAMSYGKNVVCTKETCIPEVTQGLAQYVNNPYDVNEWISAIFEEREEKGCLIDIERYDCVNVAEQYLKWILE